VNAKAHKGGRPKKEYEERDDGRNFERFDRLAGHVLSVMREDVEDKPRKARATAAVPKRRRPR